MLNASGDFVHERSLFVLVEAAQRLGISVDVAALAPTRHQVERDILVPTVEYQAILQSIFDNPSDTLGIDLADVLPLEASGLWGFLLRSSSDFDGMLRRAERYVRVFFRFFRLRLTDADEGLVATCELPSPSPFKHREQAVCFFLGQWLTWGRELTGEAITAEAVRMRWSSPPNRAPLEAFFGSEIDFGADDDAVIFDRGILDLALPERTRELAEMFESYAAAMIRRLGPEISFAERVSQALSESFLTERTSEAAIAQRLGLSTRTMRRRLAEERWTFRHLRQELLLSRAERLLREPLPVAEVSYLLGYSEPSTFHRAFREWTGLAPGEWRERHI